MGFSSGDLGYAVVLTAILLAIILLAVAIYQFFLEPIRKRRRVNQRLTESGEYMRRSQILKERSGAQTGWRMILLGKILGDERLVRVQRYMLQADVYHDPGRFWGKVLLIDLGGLIVGYWALRNGLLALLIAAVLAALPCLYLRWKKRDKTARFERQMPDAMELLARSLRAGHTMPSAIELLGEEMEDPLGTEMKIVYEEQRFGMSVAESLINMLQRVDSLDLRYFVSAVLIQQDTGGNLAELMENIARVVRDRLNFKAKVRALAASGRYSAMIMIVTPIVAFIGLLVLAPSYEQVLLTSSTGIKLLLVGITLSLIGGYTLRRMIQALEG